MENATKYVLVGIDGTPEGQLALRWAVDAAGRRGLAVRVVRAYLSQVSQWPAIGAEGYIPDPPPVELYQAELDAAVDFVRDRLGYQNGSGWLTQQAAADAILLEGADAELVVVGTRSRNKLSAAILGSVATAVTAKCDRPVVVVRGDRRTGPILVGTDGSADSDEALAFAFDEAERSGTALNVVYCWQPQDRHEAPIESTRHLLRDWLAESLAPYDGKYPSVQVRASVVEGRAASKLTELTAESSLAVVGSRGRGGVAGLLLGSVSQSLLHHADCPVAVVHEPRDDS
ncbi:universal stress protein [Kribbella sancticallisti]|uniref:Universal stress protein n=1 Tax=Kribbella sancticallisti TaxID=460087 RepID=A0ABP4QQJ0_9ACTN